MRGNRPGLRPDRPPRSGSRPAIPSMRASASAGFLVALRGAKLNDRRDQLDHGGQHRDACEEKGCRGVHDEPPLSARSLRVFCPACRDVDPDSGGRVGRQPRSPKDAERSGAGLTGRDPSPARMGDPDKRGLVRKDQGSPRPAARPGGRTLLGPARIDRGAAQTDAGSCAAKRSPASGEQRRPRTGTGRPLHQSVSARRMVARLTPRSRASAETETPCSASRRM